MGAPCTHEPVPAVSHLGDSGIIKCESERHARDMGRAWPGVPRISIFFSLKYVLPHVFPPFGPLREPEGPDYRMATRKGRVAQLVRAGDS